jgi:hypothetical protein
MAAEFVNSLFGEHRLQSASAWLPKRVRKVGKIRPEYATEFDKDGRGFVDRVVLCGQDIADGAWRGYEHNRRH